MKEWPASADDSLRLRPFSHEHDRDIFAARTEGWARPATAPRPRQAASTTSSTPSGSVCTPRAAWFVAIDGEDKGRDGVRRTGRRRGERADLDPPPRTARGYGTAALRRSRSELAAQFPAVPLVVRTRGAAR